ncbi:MAG: 16S rRNA (cytosine(1402)-N(4))-methyltransferase RsmH [Turneriella sp.]
MVRSAECLSALPPGQRKVWDGTTGLGGHLLALSEQYPEARLLASDTDAAMLEFARERLGNRVAVYRHANFADIPFSDEAPLGFIFLDLGISSAHLDYFERGFSFRFDQPLDMRMDASTGVSAADLLQTESEESLARIFFEYGDEKLSRRIAREIVSRRRTDPVTTTTQLAEICKKMYPPKHKAKGHADRHPATRVFQALRIAVNNELGVLRTALEQLPQQLAPGGRMAVISFHSLEDRLVKHAFRNLAYIPEADPTAKSNFRAGDFRLIEPGGIAPDEEEIQRNPRSRSARLRILEKR